MADGFVSRGFTGRRRHPRVEGRVPPGQYVTLGFPVLSAGPTPHTPLDEWSFSIDPQEGESTQWSWPSFQELPTQEFVVDIHCVTKWSKLDTRWEGVMIDTLLERAGLDPSDPSVQGQFGVAYCDGGYTTNIPVNDLVGGKAFVAYRFDGAPLAPEHGGPARLVVPHLYFWKSAKWIRGLRLTPVDMPGFWESLGYHNYGDPWREQRYQGD